MKLKANMRYGDFLTLIEWTLLRVEERKIIEVDAFVPFPFLQYFVYGHVVVAHGPQAAVL